MEAHLTAQYERLSRTTAGRYTLSEAGIRYTPTITPKTNISPVQRTHLKIFPIPRNMNPTHHTERRVERAKALHTRFATNNKAAYVDAAEIQGRHAFSVAVINYVGQTISGVSIKTTNPEEAEEAAIALAIANTPNAFIISDSKSAIRNYIKGRISPLANKILAQNAIALSKFIGPQPTPHSPAMRPPTNRLELSPPEPTAQPRSERRMRRPRNLGGRHETVW